MTPDSRARTLSDFLIGLGVVILGMVSEFLLGAILPSEVMQSLYVNGGFLILIILCFAGGLFILRRVLLGNWRYRYDSIIYMIAAVIFLASAGQTIFGLQTGHPFLFLAATNPILMNLLWMFVLPPVNPWTTMLLGAVFILAAWLNYRIVPPIIGDLGDTEEPPERTEPYRWWEVVGSLTRISVWLGSLFLFILCYVLLGSPPLSSTPWSPLYFPPIWIALLLGIIAISFFNSVAFIINQLNDVETDQLHTEKAGLPVSSGRVSKNKAISVGIILLTLGMFFGILVSPWFLFTILFIFIFAIIYSIPPVRLKGRPFLDLIIIGLGFGTWAVLTAWTAYTSLPSNLLPQPLLPILLLIGPGLFYAGTHGIHTASDYSADVKAGINTTAVYLGPKNATRLGIILIALGLLMLYGAVGYYTHLFWYGLLKYKSILLLIFLGLPFFALFQQFRSWQLTKDAKESQLHQLQKQGRLVTYLLFLILVIYLLLYVFLFYPVYYPHYFFPWI